MFKHSPIIEAKINSAVMGHENTSDRWCNLGNIINSFREISIQTDFIIFAYTPC